MPGVHGVGKCRERKSGLGWIVDIHIKVSGDLRVTEGHALAHAVEDRLRALPERIVDVTVHVEPAQDGTPRESESPA